MTREEIVASFRALLAEVSKLGITLRLRMGKISHVKTQGDDAVATDVEYLYCADVVDLLHSINDIGIGTGPQDGVRGEKNGTGAIGMHNAQLRIMANTTTADGKPSVASIEAKTTLWLFRHGRPDDMRRYGALVAVGKSRDIKAYLARLYSEEHQAVDAMPW
jgi:hypothetical protein